MRRLLSFAAPLLIAITAVSLSAQRPTPTPLSDEDVSAIAKLLQLEDARTYDEAVLSTILGSGHPEVRRRAVQSVGRIADTRGAGLIAKARTDKDIEVAATAVWAAGQLRDAAAVPWLRETLDGAGTPSEIAREAAIALGKIQAPAARAALVAFLSSQRASKAPPAVIGEALLSLGRFPGDGDLAAILKWTGSPDVEVRWRAAWALFRPKDPAALPELLRLAEDPAPEVRFWAVRGLIPYPGVDPAPSTTLLRAAVGDPDRRVRTEALRTLSQHDDDTSFGVVVKMLDSPDTWLSVSAAEGLARQESRADVVVPKLAAAAGVKRPLALRLTVRQSLTRLGPAGREALAGVPTDGLPSRAPAARAPRPQPQLLSEAEYRRIVRQWIVPDYSGAPKPRVEWTTPRGIIQMELYPGDAPLGLEYLLRVVESGEIAGTEFTRVVPNFVAQQEAIRNDVVLRDEVSRRGLTRGNLSWASAGLDTGRPGYTIGVTPMPHNEGNFTALGRVVRGMEVVDRLELGDTVTAARRLR